jgi:hypothetical protein
MLFYFGILSLVSVYVWMFLYILYVRKSAHIKDLEHQDRRDHIHQV